MVQVKNGTSRRGRRPGRPAGHIAAAWFFLVSALVCCAAPAAAAPLVDSRVGGLSLVGPATAHPASTYYNPAALALIRGHHVFIDGTVRLGLGSVERRQVDHQTGAVTDNLAPAQDLTEVFPQFYLGLSSNLGSDKAMVSLSASTPVAQRLPLLSQEGLPAGIGSLRPRGQEAQQEVMEKLFDPTQQGSTRYQVVDLTLYHMFLSLSASYRLADWVTVGASMSYVYGMLDLAFVRDAALEGGTRRDNGQGESVALDDCGSGGGTPCNYENDLAAEAIRTRGASHGIGFAIGLLFQPHPDVDLGLGYRSEVYSVDRDDIAAQGDAWALRSLASLANWQGAETIYRDLKGRSMVSYSLPDSVHVGLTWRPLARLALNAQFRWLNLSRHDKLTIRLTGTEFRQEPRMPDRIVHYRGFDDAFVVQVAAAYKVLSWLEIQAAAMLETAAVPEAAVTVANIDALKADLLLALHWRIGRSFSLRLGYGVVVMPGVDVIRSDFSPDQMVDCVDSRFNVDHPACANSAQGRGLPSAAGKYSLLVHRVGVGFSYDLY